MKIQVICRGSTHDGIGHLIRARTFAQAAQISHDVEIVAITDPGLQHLFDDLQCPVAFARNDRDVTEHLDREPPDVRLFDLIYLDADVFDLALTGSRRAVLTASLSPVFDHMNRVEVMFSRSHHAEAPPGVVAYGGLQYSIFGENCTVIGDLAYRQTLNNPVISIAVCMGGSDAANKSLAVLRALSQYGPPALIWVLLGEGYAHSYTGLAACSHGSPQQEVILAKTNRSLWRIMSDCSVAILAGGLTTIEAVYAGLPTINLFERPEHAESMAGELFDIGACLNGGMFTEESLSSMTDILRELDQDRDRLWQMHRRCHGLVDALGCDRVLGVMEKELAQRQTGNNAETR